MAVYCADHKMLFVHVPKTGGTSVQFWLQEHAKGQPLKGVKHWSYKNIINKHKDLQIDFSFAIVRNPWDLAVSWYFFKRDRAQRILSEGKTKNKGKMSREYNEWVLAEFEKGIDYWFQKMNPASQFEKVDGVDCVIKLENITEEFKSIQHLVGCNQPIGNYNFSQRERDYRLYYNDYSKNLIAKKFEKDISKFGYKF
jgi:hypothetical protein